jgi:hypothetical protein
VSPGTTTEALWRLQNNTRRQLAESMGSCVADQRSIFDTTSSNAGEEFNRCADDVLSESLYSLRTAYYAELDISIRQLSGMVNYINYYMARTNVVRDQQILIALLDNEVEFILLRGNNREPVLIMEVTNYIDVMVRIANTIVRVFGWCIGSL